MTAEHLDDLVLHDCQWIVMVAIVDLCLDWLFHLRRLRLCKRSHWRHVSHPVPCYFSSFVWNMGVSVAGFQSRSYGGTSWLNV